MASGYKCIMHMHTMVTEIDIEEVVAVYDKDHSKFIKHTTLKSGNKGIVKIHVKSLKYNCFLCYIN